ncbi:MAG: hypothetical protein AAFV98_02245 [Chloroflexota bacterium]
MSSRVMEAWEDVLKEAVSSDFDEQQFALVRIGMVLQRHNPRVQMPSDAPEDMLSRELIRLTLNERRQADAVEYLTALIIKHPQRADSILYALSNAQAPILAEPLLALLEDIGSKFNKDARFQAVTALVELLRFPDDQVMAALRNHDIVPLLDKWAEGKDRITADKAEIVADKIEDLLDNETED